MKQAKYYLLLALLAPAFTFIACKSKAKSESKSGKVTDIPVTSKSEAAKASFAEGLALADENNGNKARDAFSKAIQQDSTFAIAYLYRSNYAQSNQEFMDYMNSAKAHLDSASDWEKMYYDYEYTFVTNDWDKRVATLQKMAAAYPDAARIQVDLGNTYQGGNQADKERAAYQKAIELDPKWIGGYNALVQSYLFSEPKDFKKAEEMALKSVELAPKSSNSQIALGDCYRAEDDLEKALTAYTKAVELEPELPVAYLKKGHVNSFLGKYDEARNDYMEAAKHDIDNIGSNFNIALTYLYAGDHQKSVERFMADAAKTDASGASASKIAGDKLGYYTNCALVCLHYNDVAHLKELVGMMQGPSDQGANEVGSTEAKLTGKANMLYWQAMTAALEGKLDEAKAKAAEIKTTVEPVKDPTKLQAYEMAMGYINMKEKNYTDAVGHFEKANPNSVYTQYWLAMANEAAGNKDKANEILKKVSVYNFNGVDYAVIRNEVKKKVAP